MPTAKQRAVHAPSNANPSEPKANISRLIPVTDWPSRHPWPPLGGLRHLIFHAESNGFKEVICRVGRRVLIDESAFFNWAKERGGLK